MWDKFILDPQKLTLLWYKLDIKRVNWSYPQSLLNPWLSGNFNLLIDCPRKFSDNSVSFPVVHYNLIYITKPYSPLTKRSDTEEFLPGEVLFTEEESIHVTCGWDIPDNINQEVNSMDF